MTYASENRLRSNTRKIRRTTGLSREALAVRAGTALETLRRLELGLVVGMKIETLMRIAGALGVAPTDLLPDLGCAVKPEAVPPKRRRVDPAQRISPRPGRSGSTSRCA